jgi:hypothetical protein
VSADIRGGEFEREWEYIGAQLDRELDCPYVRDGWLISEGWAAEDVFIDLHGIAAGARWREALRRPDERREAVVLLASPAGVASTEWQLEVRLAEDFGKSVT